MFFGSASTKFMFLIYINSDFGQHSNRNLPLTKSTSISSKPAAFHSIKLIIFYVFIYRSLHIQTVSKLTVLLSSICMALLYLGLKYSYFIGQQRFHGGLIPIHKASVDFKMAAWSNSNIQRRCQCRFYIKSESDHLYILRFSFKQKSKPLKS